MENKREKPFLPNDADMKTKVISWIVIGVIVATFWSMLNFALLTFIFAFIFANLLMLITKKLSQMGMKRTPDKLIIIIMYALFAVSIAMLGTKAVPVIGIQASELSRIIMAFDITQLQGSIDDRLYTLMSDFDFGKYIEKITDAGVSLGGKIGGFGLNIFLAFILSLLMLMEKNGISKFGKKLEQSKISYIYQYCMYFGSSFTRSFGKVMKVQVMIAFINSIITMIGLFFMGFPQIPALGVMVFALGLIPVAGAFVSLFPLCIIGFNIGGMMTVVAVLVMIGVVHAIEAYILNPNLMANKTKLPVFLVFLILVVGEHYLGAWGLLIGVPLFIFLMDIVDVNYEEN